MHPNTDTRSPGSRRSFLRRGVLGTVLFGLGSAWGWASGRAAAPSVSPAGRQLGPQFSYRLGNLAHTPPELVQYAETHRWPTGLKEARALAVGPGNEVVVGGDRAIALLDARGERVRQVSLAEPPRCLAADNDGILYVGLRDHVETRDLNGVARSRWESAGPKAVLTSIALGEKDVFVADAGNRIVLRYNRAGKLLGRLGKKDAARNVPGFVVPSPYFDLAVGPGNLLWVANPGQHRLEAYTFTGDFETSWGEAANAITGFCGCCNPAHFALFPDGRFVTSEKGLTRLKVYSPKGELEGVVAGPEAFPKLVDNPNANALGLDVAVDAQGRVLVADPVEGAIRVYERRKPV